MPKPYNPQDKYFKKAKQVGYLARSAFKLEEIQQKFHILKPGDHVLDLGASPGSWLQYALQIAGPQAELVGVDLSDIPFIAQNIKTLKADIFDHSLNNKLNNIHKLKFSIILSDLAPQTSGIKDADHFRSLELARQVLRIANNWLKPKGNLVIKVFQGQDLPDFIQQTRKRFVKLSVYKPKASRDRSRETYIIGQYFK